MISISLRPGVTLASAEQGTLLLERQGRKMALRGISGLEPTLRLLGNETTECRLLFDLHSNDNSKRRSSQGIRLCAVLQMLARMQLIEFQAHTRAGQTLRAIPLGELSSFDFGQLALSYANVRDRAASYQLSRFACTHRVSASLVVECPLTSIRVTTTATGAGAIIAALIRPRRPYELSRELSFMTEQEVLDFIGLLAASGAISQVGDDGLLAEDKDADLRQREFHDVLMHMQSRFGLTDNVLGGLFPFVGKITPAPAIKLAMSDECIMLPRPDLQRIVRMDPPLAKVMENRRSIRHYSQVPLSKEQLSEFLYRVGRVRALRRADGRDPRSYELTDRTYPSGGGAYDLEIYVAIRDCSGIPSGLYHYGPLAHILETIDCRSSDLTSLFQGAYMATGKNAFPPALFIVSARFARLAWKYRGIAYATTLRNVGVLYDAMYLAATAMNLAPCGIGCGDSALFGRITSLSPLIESSVGEFMLGVPAER